MNSIIDFNETIKFCAFFLITTIVGVVFISIGLKKRGYLFYIIGLLMQFSALCSIEKESEKQRVFDIAFSLTIAVISAVLLIIIENKTEIKTAISKKTAAKGWNNLSTGEKGRIISAREPYKVRYMPRYDNLYLQLFAEHDETNIPDDLMRAYDYLEEAKWQEAWKLFSHTSIMYSSLAYPCFGEALCYLKINTVQGIAENIGRLENEFYYKQAIERGGSIISETIQRLRPNIQENKKKEYSELKHSFSKLIENNRSHQNDLSEKLAEILKEMDGLSKNDKLLYLSDAVDNDRINLDEYSELVSRI